MNQNNSLSPDQLFAQTQAQYEYFTALLKASSEHMGAHPECGVGEALGLHHGLQNRCSQLAMQLQALHRDRTALPEVKRAVAHLAGLAATPNKMARQKRERERCDHCKKFVTVNGHSRSDDGLFTLEGLVSPGVDISFAVCGKCCDQRPDDRAYWDNWVHSRMEAQPSNASADN